jgi:hypothetical protein
LLKCADRTYFRTINNVLLCLETPKYQYLLKTLFIIFCSRGFDENLSGEAMLGVTLGS